MADVDALFERYLKRRSRRLRNEIVEAHLDLVEYHVSRLSKGHTETDDARQQAMIALIGAVERFDPEGGASFRTFANRTVEGELKRLRRDKGWSVRPPRRIQELALLVRRTENTLAQKLGRTPRIADIAEHLNESEDRILEAISAGGAIQADSLDAPVPGSEDSAPPDRLGGEAGGYSEVENRMLVSEILSSLSERDRQVLVLRFRDRKTQQEISDELGVSQSYLSRVLRQALERAGDVIADED